LALPFGLGKEAFALRRLHQNTAFPPQNAAFYPKTPQNQGLKAD
jgi:hypothetical protein